MKKLLAMILAIGMMASLLAGCGGDQSGNNTSPDGSNSPSAGNNDTQGNATAPVATDGTMTIGIVSRSGGFDHVGTHGQSDDLNTWLAWGTLFRQNAETGEMEPSMVDTYEWVDDTHLRLTLKDGITAADGEAITAEDALFSLERYATEGSFLVAFVSQYDFENSFVDENDPLTFTLAYHEPFGPGIRYLYLPIVPKDWATTGAGTEDATWWQDPNSTGAYTCVENVDGAYVTFQLRDDYWGDTTGMAENITIKYYGEESTMFIDFQNSVLDACFGLSSDDAEALNNTPGVTSVIQSENDIYMLVLPEYVEQFQDENVRQAIAHAIDYEQVAIAGFGSLWTPCDSVLPTNVFYHKATDMPYSYDPELAAQLMAQSAYPNGFDLKVVITNSNENINMMTVIQAYLSTIGINITVEQYDIPTAVPMLQAGDSGLTLNHGMGGNPQLEPAISLQNYCTDTTNLSVQINDADWNNWLNTGLHSVDTAARQQAYESMQDWAVGAYRLLPVCESGYAWAYRDTIASAATAAPSAPDLTQFVMAD